MANNEDYNYYLIKKLEKDKSRIQMYANNTYKCKCGHSVTIRPVSEKALCRWCGKWVFKNKQDEFKFRMKEKIR